MKYTLIAIIALVVAAGCIGGGETEETLTTNVQSCSPEVIDGVIITDFMPDHIEQRSKDTFFLGLTIQNLGDSKASNIIAELSNVGSLDIAGENKKHRVSDIAAPTEGIEEKDEVFWEVTAPDITTTEQDLTVEATLSYDYVTSGEADIVFIPTEDWRIMRQEGETLVDPKQLCTSGPLTVSVEPANPVIGDPGQEKDVRLSIALINNGYGKAGNVYSAQYGQYYVDSVELTLPNGVEITDQVDCAPFTEHSGNTHIANKVYLSTQDTKFLRCRLTITTTPATKNTYRVKAKAIYRYRLSETTGVTVLPAEHFLKLKPTTDAPATIDFSAENLVINTNVSYDGNCLEHETEFNDSVKTQWSASIRNDNSGIYPLDFISVAGNCTDGYDVTFGKPSRAPSKLLCAEPVKIVLKAVYNSFSDSRELKSTANVTSSGWPGEC